MKKLNIIALAGKSKAGKNTVGQMLQAMGDGKEMAFADKLKQICMEMFGLSHDDMYTEEGKQKKTTFDCLMCPSCKTLACHVVTLDRTQMGECKVCKTVGALSVFKSKWTNRAIAQHIGTEGFRAINPKVWVDFVLGGAENVLRGTVDAGPLFVVITDCRFPSEWEAVWAAGGEVWRIHRPETDKQTTGIAGHASETELDKLPDSACQAVFHNTGTLDDLRAKVQMHFNRFASLRFNADAA